ncbi:mediator of RNA polymerase II transcription subunit 11-like [Arachis stenosperma]|uniref:mediator of RNA polymerase II transcription subunit 11-like n=1 Tax=Arachis stenosperma TaxID=217475 RepID=UPI0025AD2E02|nr:mediator of RNA polymerase II transcription subunit 11-like [Arachis stenosperma]
MVCAPVSCLSTVFVSASSFRGEVTFKDSQGQTTPLQRLQNVDKVLEVAGGVMDELASPISPRKDMVQNQCLEFLQLIKLMKIQLPLVFAFCKFLIQIDIE